MNSIFSLIASITLMASLSLAAPCQLTTTRYACPGQERDSYSKCGGQQSCVSTAEVASVNECAEMALNACANHRFTVTKYKSVTALFANQPVTGGIDFCAQDMGGYVVSANYPFRHSNTCN